MNQNQTSNRYDYLRSCYRGRDATNMLEPSRKRIGEDPETIDILSSLIPDSGQFAVGFIVYWADGRSSQRKPDPAFGVFESEREARLWAVGYMLAYAKHFTRSTQSDLKKAEYELAQQVLF